jgi:hypothetical protein
MYFLFINYHQTRKRRETSNFVKQTIPTSPLFFVPLHSFFFSLSLFCPYSFLLFFCLFSFPARFLFAIFRVDQPNVSKHEQNRKHRKTNNSVEENKCFKSKQENLSHCLFCGFGCEFYACVAISIFKKIKGKYKKKKEEKKQGKKENVEIPMVPFGFFCFDYIWEKNIFFIKYWTTKFCIVSEYAANLALWFRGAANIFNLFSVLAPSKIWNLEFGIAECRTT